MKLFAALFATVLLFGLAAQAQHKPKLAIKSDLLCCGCTAVVNGTCIYRCGLCPLIVTTHEASRTSLLPAELAPFLPEMAAPQCKSAAAGGGGGPKQK